MDEREIIGEISGVPKYINWAAKTETGLNASKRDAVILAYPLDRSLVIHPDQTA